MSIWNVCSDLNYVNIEDTFNLNKRGKIKLPYFTLVLERILYKS